MEKELDTLIQKWACKQRSIKSGLPAQVGHHFIHRANKLLRWDIKNIIPLTNEEHRLVHTGEIDDKSFLFFRHYDYCLEMKNKSYKNYLLEHGITEQEFLKEKKKELLAFL